MKKLMMLMLAVGLLSSPCLFAAGNQGGARAMGSQYIQSLDANGNGQYDPGEVDPGKEYPSGPCKCYCPVTKFVPQYYKTCRCEWEPYTVQKKCWRNVPQYYTKTYCKNCKECYYVTETKYRCKKCYDQHCRYVPCTYIKSCCVENPCTSNSSCGAGCNGS